MKKVIFGSFLFIVTSSYSLADTELQSLENISKELVKIRQEIETLHNRVNFEKDAYQDQLRAYVSQKSDLQVRISRAELNVKDLQRELQKLAARNKKQNRAQNVITPVLKVAIDQLRHSIKESLPFKLEQRLQALDDIEQRLESNIISPNKAANQLWAYIEDELLLGKSSGIYTDTLRIDGQARLVKVLRIGKIALFYKAQDNHYGVVKKLGKQWQQISLNDSNSNTQLEHLFDSFSKNIRNGQFTVPNFLPKS